MFYNIRKDVMKSEVVKSKFSTYFQMHIQRQKLADNLFENIDNNQDENSINSNDAVDVLEENDFDENSNEVLEYLQPDSDDTDSSNRIDDNNNNIDENNNNIDENSYNVVNDLMESPGVQCNLSNHDNTRLLSFINDNLLRYRDSMLKRNEVIFNSNS